MDYFFFRIFCRLRRFYERVTLFAIEVRYRYFRKALNKVISVSRELALLYFRFLRRFRFRILRLLVFFMWKRWLDKVEGLENISRGEPAIIASNHLSYFDFFVLASFLEKQTVFVATKGLDRRSFVGWFMRLDTIIYVDREKPGYGFFKEMIRQSKNKKLIVIYPEGTRSRSGKMLAPKPGFIKLALLCGIPIIPLAMKGTYDILPPHRRFPKFTKCGIEIGKKVHLSPSNSFLKDIFYRCSKSGKYTDLTDEGIEEIAFRIMNQVRMMSGQEWDEDAVRKAEKYSLAPQNQSSLLV